MSPETVDNDDVVLAVVDAIENALEEQDATHGGVSINDQVAALVSISLALVRGHAGTTEAVRKRHHEYVNEVWAMLDHAETLPETP